MTRTHPNADLILSLDGRKAMCRHKFIRIGRPGQVTDLGVVLVKGMGHHKARSPYLGSGIQLVDKSSASSIPKPQLLVKGSAPTRKDVTFPGCPRDGLDRGRVLVELPEWLISTTACTIPHEQLIVIAATCKLTRLVRVPLQAAYFLPMPIQGAEVVGRGSDVPKEDRTISGA